jgi:hypothetical protein
MSAATKLGAWLQHKLHSLLVLQAILTVVAVPFLSMWEIPLSRIGIIGNILFTPVITVFILISSLIFLTELLHIPNGILCSALNFITTHWLHALSYASPTWLVTIPPATLTVLIVVALLSPLSKTKTLIVLSLLVSVAQSPHSTERENSATTPKQLPKNLSAATYRQR